MELKLSQDSISAFEGILLIVPYGIETWFYSLYEFQPFLPFNRTLWN